MTTLIVRVDAGADTDGNAVRNDASALARRGAP